MSTPASPSSAYVVVEGPIGAGKTTLARRLAADLGARLLLERPEDNPFLPRFYRDPVGGALPAQLCFLLQRAGQAESFAQPELFDARRVADFFFEKDRLFAELTLAPGDLRLYEAVFERLAWQAPVPSVVVYLKGSTDLLLRRIAERGRDYEAPIERGYLEALAAAYARFFGGYDAAPVIEVDVGETDFALDAVHYRRLLALLSQAKGYVRFGGGDLFSAPGGAATGLGAAGIQPHSG